MNAFDQMLYRINLRIRGQVLSESEILMLKAGWNAAIAEAIEIVSSGELDPATLTKRIQELKP